MGKVGKKDKNKISLVKKVEDFKKIKKKVGRKLKRLNETLPTVKTSKVVLKNQFKERKVKTELQHFKNKIYEGKLSVSRINEIHETIMLTLRKIFTGRSTERKDSIIMTRELLKSLTNNDKTSGDEIYSRSASDILDLICPLFVDSEHEVRLEIYKLFEMVMSNPLMKLASCQSLPIVSSNLLRAMSNHACGEDALLAVDILVEHNHLFVVSISHKLVNSILNNLQKQTCAKLQSSMYVEKSNNKLAIPNQNKRNKINSIIRLKNIFKVFISHLQQTNSMYYYALFSDNILDDDETCLNILKRTVGLLLQILQEILLPIPMQNYCFDSLNCSLLQSCLDALNIIFAFASLALRSISLLGAFVQENIAQQFQELTGNAQLKISQKISKRGKWTGVEKDMGFTINKSITQINNFILRF